VFYDAEHVLSAIDKFLVHLLVEGEGRSEMGDGIYKRREWGENGECIEVREMGIHEKRAIKRNIFGIWGRPFGATALCHTFLESCFFYLAGHSLTLNISEMAKDTAIVTTEGEYKRKTIPNLSNDTIFNDLE